MRNLCAATLPERKAICFEIYFYPSDEQETSLGESVGTFDETVESGAVKTADRPFLFDSRFYNRPKLLSVYYDPPSIS